jgi:hypothetical protein
LGSALAFTRFPFSLDELDHADPHPVAQRTKGSSDRRCRLSLPLPGDGLNKDNAGLPHTIGRRSPMIWVLCKGRKRTASDARRQKHLFA